MRRIISGIGQSNDGCRETPLRLFIQASSLSSEGDNDSDRSTFAEGVRHLISYPRDNTKRHFRK